MADEKMIKEILSDAFEEWEAADKHLEEVMNIFSPKFQFGEAAVRLLPFVDKMSESDKSFVESMENFMRISVNSVKSMTDPQKVKILQLCYKYKQL